MHTHPSTAHTHTHSLHTHLSTAHTHTHTADLIEQDKEVITGRQADRQTDSSVKSSERERGREEKLTEREREREGGGEKREKRERERERERESRVYADLSAPSNHVCIADTLSMSSLLCQDGPTSTCV